MSMITKTLIVDDHRIFSLAFAELLNGIDGINCQFQARCGAEALDILKENPIDLLFLEISIPEQDGFQIFQQIVSSFGSVKVIILTQFDTDAIIIHFIRKGVAGFLTKDVDLDELKTAIKAVTSGERYIQKTLSSKLSERMLYFSGFPSIEISPQERRLIYLLEKGLTSKEIADKICLSVKTINSYRENLLVKTGTKNVAELISFAFRNAILRISTS
jgi:DNA-binding NarL/FixJ family response regulator